MVHHAHPSMKKTRLLLLAALLAAFAVPIRGAVGQSDSSLGLIPADAAYYASMQRNREQLDAVAKSKTWARITKLPAYQMALLGIQQQMANPQFAQAREMMEQQENRDLLEMLGDAVSNDIFVFGAANWVEFVDLMKQVYNAMNYGQFAQMVKTPGDQKAIQSAYGRAPLRVLARNPEKIRTPDFVLGFKIKNLKKAEAQIARLEGVLNLLVTMEPKLEGRVKRVKVGDDSFVTLNLDGEMVPWESIPIKDIEEAAGEFDGVVKNLKKLKVTISVGVRHGYLMLAIGSSTDGLKQLGGQGARLTSLSEMKPLVDASGKRLTSISYTSKAMVAKGQMSADDIDSVARVADNALDAAGIPEDKRKQIAKDVEGLAEELKKSLPKLGAALSFTYLSDRGYEGYDYKYGEFPEVDGSKQLSLLNHTGGDPILAAVGRSRSTLERYQALSKWLKIAYGHAAPVVVEKLKKEDREQFEEYSKIVLPLLQRFDDTTSKQLLPSLADGQAGFVLDAKWKSKQWQQAMPVSDKAMPMLELGFLVGVSDADLLEKAMRSYGKIVEDALAKAKEKAPDAALPFTKIPDPEVKTVSNGKLFSWKMPEEAKLDPQIAVTAGLTDKVGVIALSTSHAERLLAEKPIKIEGGPLADCKRPMAAASYFNWPLFVDSFTPWVMFALDNSGIERMLGAGDNPQQQKQARAQVAQQVRVVLTALKAIRGSTSTTYVQAGALVTHSELVIKDQ